MCLGEASGLLKPPSAKLSNGDVNTDPTRPTRDLATLGGERAGSHTAGRSRNHRVVCVVGKKRDRLSRRNEESLTIPAMSSSGPITS